jgi:leader peptidase (prepilin peptidase)/N-methyltransferase
MGLDTVLDPRAWQPVPFEFWALAFFVLGCIVGSFLNVCIHRMPLGQSVVSPPSHCPHCRYSIPWFLNIPLVTWLYLRGKCRNCGAPIAARYFLVELLTGLAFLSCWVAFGVTRHPFDPGASRSALLALVYCLVLAGFIVATFIDFEHFIIPDEITLGGTAVGFVCSFLVPALHRTPSATVALERSALGIAMGAGLVYGILRLGKLLYGRQKFELPARTRVFFTETTVKLPDREIPYEELFYRKSDAIVLHAGTAELIDRGYAKVPVRLSPDELRIGEDRFKPEAVQHLEVVTDEIVVPREAMGLGDVKFMAAIGAFLGWQAVLFSLMVSALIGAAVGIGLILLRRREWSSRLPYGPYIALAATLWIFAGNRILTWWLDR